MLDALLQQLAIAQPPGAGLVLLLELVCLCAPQLTPQGSQIVLDELVQQEPVGLEVMRLQGAQEWATDAVLVAFHQRLLCQMAQRCWMAPAGRCPDDPPRNQTRYQTRPQEDAEGLGQSQTLQKHAAIRSKPDRYATTCNS
jgi:hypothetical protein